MFGRGNLGRFCRCRISYSGHHLGYPPRHGAPDRTHHRQHLPQLMHQCVRGHGWRLRAYMVGRGAKDLPPRPGTRNTTPSRRNRKPRPIATRARTRLSPTLKLQNLRNRSARVGDLEPKNPTRSPELGRSPFWERPSRALPDPEEMPASDPSRPPVGSAVNKGPSEHRELLFTASFHAVRPSRSTV